MLYNGHIHVFNSNFTPDDFLKVGLPGKSFDFLAEKIKNGLETEFGRRTLKFLLARGHRNNKVKRILTFFDIGIEASQRRVFDRIHQTYRGYNPRYFVLTVNMDYMTDALSTHSNFDTQLQEVFQVKSSFPDEFLLFICCDPRYLRGAALRDWFAKHYESGKAVGIKLYPPLGFFPFDKGLDELYAYANEKNIPIITHTTRTGAFYIGNRVKELAGISPQSLNYENKVMDPIYARIKRYYDSKDSKVQLNDFYCNVFSHPENYIPILEKYKNLKICFAHYGGVKEILGQTYPFMKKLENDPNKTWTDLIREMILNYKNVYTDISYSLADPNALKFFLPESEKEKIKDRIIFGTDYFMEEQEDSESNVFANYRNKFIASDSYTRMTITNPHTFVFGTQQQL